MENLASQESFNEALDEHCAEATSWEGCAQQAMLDDLPSQQIFEDILLFCYASCLTSHPQ